MQRFEVKISPLHNDLQKRFEAFLKKTAATAIDPNLGGVDLRYTDSKGLILCEIKPCTADSVRFAIRTAMGQLLDYRQNSRQARLQIVLAERPRQRDLELARSNDFSVAFPSGRGFEIEWPRKLLTSQRRNSP
jgi:hypothetical protein